MLNMAFPKALIMSEECLYDEENRQAARDLIKLGLPIAVWSWHGDTGYGLPVLRPDSGPYLLREALNVCENHVIFFMHTDRTAKEEDALIRSAQAAGAYPWNITHTLGFLNVARDIKRRLPQLQHQPTPVIYA